ncbi:MAG TPA: RtcB family protein, partial [Vicinamibacterales bacterium]|nr:RtcB family protein [Vicinamibacterales bacterium]
MSKRHLIAFGDVDAASRQQIERCLDAAGEESRGVLCADHHKGYSMPIGGVVASTDVVMPAGVGYDIGCGNCAVQTKLKAADVDIKRVMDEVWRTLSFGMGQNNDERIKEHPVYDSIG